MCGCCNLPSKVWGGELHSARGVRRRYGVGKWRLIQMDEAQGPVLAARSNVDLKVRTLP